MCVTLMIPINTVYRVNNVGEMYLRYNELATKTIIYFRNNMNVL